MIWTYALEASAITIVFTKGSIFKRLRENGPALWQEWAGCPLCVGVWVGAAWRYLRDAAIPPFLTMPVAFELLANGAVTGVIALLVALTVSVLDART